MFFLPFCIPILRSSQTPYSYCSPPKVFFVLHLTSKGSSSKSFGRVCLLNVLYCSRFLDKKNLPKILAKSWKWSKIVASGHWMSTLWRCWTCRGIPWSVVMMDISIPVVPGRAGSRSSRVEKTYKPKKEFTIFALLFFTLRCRSYIESFSAAHGRSSTCLPCAARCFSQKKSYIIQPSFRLSGIWNWCWHKLVFV